jgi:hypothetical protein
MADGGVNAAMLAVLQNDIPPQVVDMAMGFFTMVVVIALGIPIIRVFSRRLERGPANPGMPAELTQRLERIEQGVEAMAIEIERISEGQRFTTKLLAEQQRRALGNAAAAAPAAPPATDGKS